MILRVPLAAIGATFGWWLGVLLGGAVGAAVSWFASPLAGHAVGGLAAGLIAGGVESRSAVSLPLRGKRLRFTGATAAATALAALVLLDVQVLPWLTGGLFGAAIGAAQAKSVGLPLRAAIARALTSAAAWSLGFAVLHDGGAYAKLGVIAPGVAAVLFTLATSRLLCSRERGAPDAMSAQALGARA